MKFWQNSVLLFHAAYAICDGNSTQIIDKSDYFGKFALTVHKSHTTIAKRLPILPFMCKPMYITIENATTIFRLRPMGYCATCCPIKNLADYIQIYLVRKNKEIAVIKLSEEKKIGKLSELGVDNTVTTIMYIHGFGDNWSTETSQSLLYAYRNRNESYNILCVDWSEISAVPFYQEAKDNVKLVAKELSEFLKFYHQTGELPVKNLHIIGQSLGAHVAGFIGKTLKNFTTIARITGLEPAFPLFPIHDKSERLSEEDAEFVDIVHTNTGELGFPISIGHVDFYANYGYRDQPGCSYINFFMKGANYFPIYCNHFRAQLLYIESVVNPKAFPAFKTNVAKKRSLFTEQVYVGFSANKSFKKRSRNSLLKEKSEIIAWRRRYLRQVKQYRGDGRTIYFLDETWVNEGHVSQKTWPDLTINNARDAYVKGLSTGLKNPSGKGMRLIILHIGSEDGFVDNGLLLFE